MIRTLPVTGFTIRRAEQGWAFADANRAGIERHWRAVTAANPTLWNGRILICTGAEVTEAHFHATLAETDYASFVAWRDWGRPDESVRNCFGVPVVFSADGALLLGVMAGWTLNAGRAYPPSGTLEPKDVRAGGTVDLTGNMRTELLEETGLDLNEGTPGDMVAIFEGPRLAIAQRYDFAMSFAEMEQRFAAHKAADAQPELDRIEACWNSSHGDSRLPPYAAEIVRHFLEP